MSGSLSMRLHPERVPDERLLVVWEAVYEGYTESWDDEALGDMAAVGEEVCSVLEEMVELRANVAELVKAAQNLTESLGKVVGALPAAVTLDAAILADKIKPFEGP